MLDQARRRIGLGDNRRLVGAENSRFLEADTLARTAQIIDVIERNADHHCAVGFERVHGVQSPAKADLQDRDIDSRLDEQQDRGERAELEIGERSVRARLLHAPECFDQRGVPASTPPTRTRSL